MLFVARESLELLRPAMVEIGSGEWTSTGGYTLKPGARRFETWEVGFALQLGLERAIEYALELGLEPIWARVSTLADSLREQLTAIPGATVHDLGAQRCGIVTFGHDHVAADDLRRRLAERGINVYVSSVEDTRLDLERRGLYRIVRASVHYFNTEPELDALCAGVAAAGRD